MPKRAAVYAAGGQGQKTVLPFEAQLITLKAPEGNSGAARRFAICTAGFSFCF